MWNLGETVNLRTMRISSNACFAKSSRFRFLRWHFFQVWFSRFLWDSQFEQRVMPAVPRQKPIKEIQALINLATRNSRSLSVFHSFRKIAQILAHSLAVVLVVVLVAGALTHSAAAEDRSYDGSGSNAGNTAWGSANIDLLRIAPAAYSDGFTPISGPSARAVSNAVSAHPVNEMPNNRGMTAMVYAWGQFLDHDMDLTPPGTTESFNIPVPNGDLSFDPFHTGTATISLTRSIYDPLTGTSAANPRQQINTISAFIDGSMVYGSDSTRAAALRTNNGGKLATSAGNLLPYNTGLLANANDAHIVGDSQLFLAGDVRANENIELTSMQTLFVREHNRLADAIAATHPAMNDEGVYQSARRIVGAEIQAITYGQFVPTLMGPNALTSYSGYNLSVNPGVATEFSTAAYRVGHSMLANDIDFLDNSGNAIAPSIDLANAFFNPAPIQAHGIDPILKYLSTSQAEEVDNKVVDGVRNFLFGPPGSGGLDLASLNIQRGRDHGLASYSNARVAYGLSPATSFADITSDVALQGELTSVYSSPADVDLWVGGLAEDHLSGSSLGPTFQAIIADQFQRERDGDRFYYLNTATNSDLLSLLSSVGMTTNDLTLTNILEWNTVLTNLPANDFLAVPEPGTFTLFAAGALLLAINRRRL